mgnify:CR=1 FL=1
MSEKLTDNASVRLSHEELRQIDRLAAMDDVCRAEWLRDAAMMKLEKFRRQHKYLSEVFSTATDTANTLYSDKEKA